MDDSNGERGAHDAKATGPSSGQKDAKGKAVGYSDRDATVPMVGGRDTQPSSGPSQTAEADIRRD